MGMMIAREMNTKKMSPRKISTQGRLGNVDRIMPGMNHTMRIMVPRGRPMTKKQMR